MEKSFEEKMCDFKEMFDLFQKSVNGSCEIKYSYEKGKEMARVNGPGSLIFSGIMTLLKGISQKESEVHGITPEEYIDFICKEIKGEIEREKTLR